MTGPWELPEHDDDVLYDNEPIRAWNQREKQRRNWTEIERYVAGDQQDISAVYPMVAGMFMHPVQGVDDDGVGPAIIFAIRDTNGDSMTVGLDVGDAATLVEGLMQVITVIWEELGLVDLPDRTE